MERLYAARRRGQRITVTPSLGHKRIGRFKSRKSKVRRFESFQNLYPMNELILRPMIMADSDFMLELKNDCQTRKFAIVTHEEIKKEDHEKWLENNLQYFRVIENPENTVPIGALRVQDLEVSIWIGQAFRNQGVAKKTLQLISGQGMWCNIVEGNLASMRAFIYAGFSP